MQRRVQANREHTQPRRLVCSKIPEEQNRCGGTHSRGQRGGALERAPGQRNRLLDARSPLDRQARLAPDADLTHLAHLTDPPGILQKEIELPENLGDVAKCIIR